ncbi:MAG: PepSY domain-containing protein [Sphingomonadaceae bacterium]|nr:PepSY domain-containing protein [Sphingomonadaceae bacterium]
MSIQDRGAPLRVPLYRTIWRWHFYAALFVMPLVLVLATTGAIYLFKPQLDRWEERAYSGLSTANAVSANEQLAAVLGANPGAQFHGYRLPERAGDAAMIHIGLADGRSMRDVYVSPQGDVLGSVDPDSRIAAIVSRIHGSLFMGKIGDLIVELGACWAIVMIVTGLYLWWPRGRGPAGVVWPRLQFGQGIFLRDLHAVTGFWVSGLALVLLVTGLPWASVWGDAFRLARVELGLMHGPQDWKTGSGAPHAEHDHDAMMKMQAAGVPLVGLADMVERAKLENLPHPVWVKPPGAPERFGSPTEMAWMVKSEAQNRPLNRTISFDMATGVELSRTEFADKHVIDRIVSYGIAWHEGQLFGWINQLIGVLTAIALVTLTITGFLMWRRRKPVATLGAPPAPTVKHKMRGVAFIMLILAAFLPLLAASLLVLWLFDHLILPRLPRLARWLDVRPVSWRNAPPSLE